MSDSHKDTHDLVHLLLGSLSTMEKPDEATLDANTRLLNACLLWLAQMRKRPLTSCYEFLIPPGGDASRAGWYWRHPKHNPKDYVNWHGPFPSRKAAVEARLRQPGAHRVPLDVIEADVFV